MIFSKKALGLSWKKLFKKLIKISTKARNARGGKDGDKKRELFV